MRTLYVLCGLPGAGKTTWARDNADRLQASVVCSDDVRRDFEVNGRDPEDGDAIFAEVAQRARRLLHDGHHVVLDATHYRRRYRTYVADVVHGIDVHRVAIWFDVPVDVCLQRNAGRDSDNYGDRRMPASVIRSLADRFQPPTSREFDAIIVVAP